jgi:quercetin dioxygenase-like cupin family protein
MLTRRGFVVLRGQGARGLAPNTAGRLKRNIITRTDGPMDGYETVNGRVDLEAGALVARHTHPGIESSYIVDRTLELNVDGQGARTFKAGDGFQVRPRAPRSGKSGDTSTTIAITYVVEKGKPLASPA